MLVVDGIFVVQFYSWFLYLSLKKKKRVGEGEGGMTMDCGIVFIELNFSLTTLDFFFFFYLWKQERDGRSEQKSNSDFFKSCFGRICKIIANFPLKYISAFWMMILVIWAWKIWDQTQCSCWAQSKAVAGVLHGFLTSTLGSELHIVYWYGADQLFIWTLPCQKNCYFFCLIEFCLCRWQDNCDKDCSLCWGSFLLHQWWRAECKSRQKE